MFPRWCPGALQNAAIVTAGEPVTRRRVCRWKYRYSQGQPVSAPLSARSDGNLASRRAFENSRGQDSNTSPIANANDDQLADFTILFALRFKCSKDSSEADTDAAKRNFHEFGCPRFAN